MTEQDLKDKIVNSVAKSVKYYVRYSAYHIYNSAINSVDDSAINFVYESVRDSVLNPVRNSVWGSVMQKLETYD